MQYKFLRAIHLRSDGKKNGKDFPRGVHEVPAEFEKDPYFLQNIGAGLITEVDQEVSKLSAQERAAKLLDKVMKVGEKLASKKVEKAPAEAPPKEEAPVAVEPVSSEVLESEEKEEASEDLPKEEKKKSGKKKG